MVPVACSLPVAHQLKPSHCGSQQFIQANLVCPQYIFLICSCSMKLITHIHLLQRLSVHGSLPPHSKHIHAQTQG